MTAETTTDAAGVSQVERGVRPRAWLCELAQEDGTTRTQFVEQDPDGLRWNDEGESSPYRTTPLFALPLPKWWTCKTHGDAVPHNAWGCPDCVREMRAELADLKAQLVPLLLLAQEVRLIDAHGTTPDGDGVNGPTALWAEDWTRRLSVDTGPNVRAKP